MIIVLGADTHKRSHTIAAVRAGTGEVVADRTVPGTNERATILELPYTNPEGPVTAELTALVGARVRASIATPHSPSGSPCSRAS